VISRKALLPLVLSIACFGMTGASAEETHKEPCVGTGSATLGAGITYFPTTTANVSFTFTFNCATGGAVTGSGILTSASCGQSYGSGTFADSGGKQFSVITAGSMLVVYGQNGAYGVGNATPIPDTSTVPFGNSCSNGTARVFTLAGFVCAIDNPDITGCPDLPVNLIPPANGLNDPLGFLCQLLRNLGLDVLADLLGCP